MAELTTPDLIRQLRAMEAEAKETRRKLREGEAANGTHSLRRLELRAGDLARWIEEDHAAMDRAA